jgi:hypothetical protein
MQVSRCGSWRQLRVVVIVISCSNGKVSSTRSRATVSALFLYREQRTNCNAASLGDRTFNPAALKVSLLAFSIISSITLSSCLSAWFWCIWLDEYLLKVTGSEHETCPPRRYGDEIIDDSALGRVGRHESVVNIGYKVLELGWSNL